MGFSWSMFFGQHVGLQQASCADLPLRLPVITDGGLPIVVGADLSVVFRWNDADNFGAVSKGATLTDQSGCVILSVAQVSPRTRYLPLLFPPRRSG